MDNHPQNISPVCRKRLLVQGYAGYSDKELNDFKYGIRFAYALCATLLAIGLFFNYLMLLQFIAIVAFVGMFPPYHPFDYIYNYAVRHLINKPKIPPRTNQGRFACGMAFVWLTITIYLLSNNYIILGNIFGGIMLAIASLVSLFDICIPSMIYNALFLKKKENNKS